MGSHDITDLLHELRTGDREAEGRLISVIYGELRRLAKSHLRKERGDHSLQPTALVNEAYLRLVSVKGIEWQSRNHFFALASKLMRHVLIDHARAQGTRKRGGSWQPINIEDIPVFSLPRSDQYLALDEALIRLTAKDPRQAQIVEMRFFGGLNEDEIAEYLGISNRTVRREWRFAKAWLSRELGSDSESGTPTSSGSGPANRSPGGGERKSMGAR